MICNRSKSVEAHVGLRLISAEGAPVPVPATLLYASEDPYAVRVVFYMDKSDPNGPHGPSITEPSISAAPAPYRGPSTQNIDAGISWSFSRELLREGLHSPSGYGDVRIWPWSGNRSVAIALSSPDGYALFEAPRRVVKQFLERTYSCVGEGREDQHIDVDAALIELLKLPDADTR
ncbi:MAG TPA: SsgA family sporulation/cell division regulator [Mycobacteriales bacterium]|jgi:hypothetical protein|nr:SsgA family sporulation/cell division regulator [Mycobacteriales bacterium]